MQTSVDVFDKMTKGATVKTNHRVMKVQTNRSADNRVKITIDNETTPYDRIIFACNADATMSALTKGRTNISSLLRLMLSSVTYGDDDDLNLLDGVIHRDMSILPVEYAKDLHRNYANYIDVKYDPISRSYYHHNTFILSSWLPNVHAMLEENQLEHEDMEPMLVTYAPCDRPAPKINDNKVVGKVDNRRAHPSLSFRNQAISLLIRLVQGENGMYFCGNAVTPANGHDLSLLSGFAVAELIGAKYPFTEDAAALRDYHRYKQMCVD
jgi:predicted NAD/FAD-binding protein